MRTLLTLRQFAETNPAFSESSLRWQIFNANTNGLTKSGAILRNGRRILIDPEKFHAWIDSRQTQAA